MVTLDKKQKKIRVRGTGCYDPSDNSFDFTPFNDGPSLQTNVKNCRGGGKSWETTGSDPSRMITLKTKMSSPFLMLRFSTTSSLPSGLSTTLESMRLSSASFHSPFTLKYSGNIDVL